MLSDIFLIHIKYLNFMTYALLALWNQIKHSHTQNEYSLIEKLGIVLPITKSEKQHQKITRFHFITWHSRHLIMATIIWHCLFRLASYNVYPNWHNGHNWHTLMARIGILWCPQLTDIVYPKWHLALFNRIGIL